MMEHVKDRAFDITIAASPVPRKQILGCGFIDRTLIGALSQISFQYRDQLFRMQRDLVQLERRQVFHRMFWFAVQQLADAAEAMRRLEEM